MKVIIIEDELPTAIEMKRTLLTIDADLHIIGMLSSVADINHQSELLPKADLIFSDIQLSDGLSIDALLKFNNTVPVIFCTAYNHYALAAFKANGIDYILKPFTNETVKIAFDKFKRLSNTIVDFNQLSNDIKQEKTKQKANIIIHRGDKIIPLSIQEMALFYIDNTLVYAYTFDGKKLAINEQLDALETLVGESFFRASRQFLVNRKAVKEASKYFDRKILVHLNIPFVEQIIISRLKATEFINWLSVV
ncbi:MAG: LytTR family DNA-binding domain-containing protein [Saprospiraceae bacterium]|nr:LytTR family DNA-binding domain-containing protein [Saprospiraceae bacterium]MDP4700659.1 LytTR family DNA-binding domain-containing protein [Saprospiraceae bacterium]MDP4810981.1 LytTR family DNA-binding domain-containing protein [Saprospiraceae bacterium]MDP5048145.1 LytTR family DNA-binding domain-containing protein [Saprospiraceae bacterium]MDP5090800.1 LytTR family DNA-binding domain-containing protein [Saprospiraceae bacterium]